MTLAELRKLLKEKLDALTAYRALSAEDRTEEIRAQKDKDMIEVKQVEADIRDLEEIEAIEQRSNASINGDGSEMGGDFDDDAVIEVPDQPIYLGNEERALGSQIGDALTMITRRGGDDIVQGAESRYSQNRKREVTILEKETGFRAAGTGQVAGIASDGGMFLTGSTVVDFMDKGFNNSEVLNRCRRVTLGAGEAWAELIDVDETDRTDGSRQGGIRVYTEAELGEYDSSKTQFSKVRVEPKKLTGLIYLSDEINMYAPLVGQEVGRLFQNEFAFKKQDQVIQGTGAGQALGLQNASAKISVTKEGGQPADTIITENILSMIQQFSPQGGGKPAWYYNRNCFKELMTMTYDVGTGGVLSKLFTPPTDQTGIGTIWGWPAIPIEQCESVGTTGDLWLTDMSQYLVADKGDVLQAVSMHVKFEFGQIALRFTAYFDGMPRPVSSTTPYKGSATSPFVRIAERG